MQRTFGAVLLAALALAPGGPVLAQSAQQTCVIEPDAGDANAGSPVERFQRLGCSRGDVINGAFRTVQWRNAFASLLCDFEKQVLFSEAGPLGLLTCVSAGAPRSIRR